MISCLFLSYNNFTLCEQNLPAAGKKVKGIFIPFVENITSIAEKGGFAVANTLPGDRCFCCQLLSCIL
jgi:hypothetical protein